uniref:Subtilisin-like protease n=1 Tax=Oryza brachyantha TaxID=4533 RepID=J3LQ04_ORYBR
MPCSTNLMASLLLLAAVAFLVSPAPALSYVNHGAGGGGGGPRRRSPPVARVFLAEAARAPPPRRRHGSYTRTPRCSRAFAAELTDAELDGVVSKKRGFVRAFPGRTLRLMKTHTPAFLGLTGGAGFWRDAAGYGKGVVVGLLDTGVHATHPSFDDRGVQPPPARWKGSCEGSAAARCNNKLIGVKSFVGSDGDDEVGHGTHTASTAAGNFVGRGATDRGLGAGTAAGIAPGAHVAMYKVCSGSGCDDAAILAGFDAAIKDGVDVLSVSVGGWSSLPFDQDPIAIAGFSAVARGITVVCAAGNNGPEPSTVTNDAPWLLTVAAGSVDRSFSATVRLGNGELVDGQALAQEAAANSSSRTSSYPLLFSEKLPHCNELVGAVGSGVAGHLVVCQADALGEPVVSAMMVAGAGGVVLINRESDGYTTVLQDQGSGLVQVSVASGLSITAYAMSAGSGGAANASVVFSNTSLGVRPAPTVASFSSRGPSTVTPGVLKPDVLAPGLNILAAWPPHLLRGGGGGGLFKVISGTSMATPHVSGVAALVKSCHPDWSPAAIKLAILTTSDAADSAGGNPILDEQHERATAFLTGAGHVNPARAADPGLVYDLGVAEYTGYICALIGDGGLATIVRNASLACANLAGIPEAQLNYPIITVPLLPSTAPFTVTRTVTNVGPANSTYALKLEVPKSLTVHVSPEKLVFSGAGEKKGFSVTSPQGV